MIYRDIIKCVDKTIPSLNKSFDFLSNQNSIVVCGNGKEGYIRNQTNISINNSDFVVRINNFVTVKELTGTKKDCLFAGASTNHHLNINQFYPEIDFPNIVTNIQVLNNILKYKNIKQYSPKIIYYSRNTIQNNLKDIGYNSDMGISGLHCIILFMAICRKFSLSKFSVVGFSTKNHYDNHVTSYYYGNINTSNSKYHNHHDWNFHYNFINILLDYHSL